MSAGRVIHKTQSAGGAALPESDPKRDAPPALENVFCLPSSSAGGAARSLCLNAGIDRTERGRVEVDVRDLLFPCLGLCSPAVSVRNRLSREWRRGLPAAGRDLLFLASAFARYSPARRGEPLIYPACPVYHAARGSPKGAS